MLEELLMQYLDKFGEGFPMYQLGRNNTDAEVADMVKECLAQGKDAYEMGFVEDDPDVLY